MVLPFKIGTCLYRVNNSCTKFLKYRVDGVSLNAKGLFVKLKYVDEFGDFAYHKIPVEEVGTVYMTKKYKKMFQSRLEKGHKTYKGIKEELLNGDYNRSMKLDAIESKEFIRLKLGGEEND